VHHECPCNGASNLSLVVSVTSKFPFRSFVTTIEPPAIGPLDASSALSASKARSGFEKVTMAAAFMIGFQTLAIKTLIANDRSRL
jgi:hypothetical protein